MGQTQSVPTGTSRQLENFFHVCNIIPDIPEHTHRAWTPPATAATVPVPAAAPAPPPDAPCVSAPGNRVRSSRSSRRGYVSTDYTTDNESESGRESWSDATDTDVRDVRDVHNTRVRRSKSSRHDEDLLDRLDRRDQRRARRDRHNRGGAPSRSREAVVPAAPVTPVAPVASALPRALDRRYDLDVAPSMVNMNLQWNGAYMVAANVYNSIAVKYGYRHFLSVQQLYWEAVRRYYQLPTVDPRGHYKVSLTALMDVVRDVALLSERELSVYKDLSSTSDGSGDKSNPAQSGDGPSVQLPRVSSTKRPFYRLAYYTVAQDRDTLRAALVANHLVLVNLALFTNFLSARRGVVPTPNRDDTPVGMVAATLVGYDSEQDVWLVRFPFGLHWGDQGIGYVTGAYFETYNRDRWIMDVTECGEPPEYQRQRESEQAEGVPGRLPVRLGSGGDEKGGATEGGGEKGTGGRLRLRMV